MVLRTHPPPKKKTSFTSPFSGFLGRSANQKRAFHSKTIGDIREVCDRAAGTARVEYVKWIKKRRSALLFVSLLYGEVLFPCSSFGGTAVSSLPVGLELLLQVLDSSPYM